MDTIATWLVSAIVLLIAPYPILYVIKRPWLRSLIFYGGTVFALYWAELPYFVTIGILLGCAQFDSRQAERLKRLQQQAAE